MLFRALSFPSVACAATTVLAASSLASWSRSAAPAPVATTAAPTATIAAGTQDYGPPPGMVAIPKKVIEVGGDPEEIEALVVKNEAVGENLAAELGSKTTVVEAFYLQPYEITNEQYLRFVLATGHRPPQHWAQDALDQASREYLEANKDDKSAPPFSPKDWWATNWRSAEWSMPTKIATLPVVYVDNYDVESFVHWAGFRMMTEFEFQSAGREKDRQRYTWGDEWDRSKAITSDPDARSKPEEVGSVEAAASLHGVFDLCGNVWEWTSSPYVGLPGYKPLKYEIKRGKKPEKKEVGAQFDSSKRVVVGGSFANSPVAARLSTRRPTARDEMFSGLGFRCAADMQVARGRAEATLANLAFEQRASVELHAPGVLGFENWIVGEGRLEKPNYALIEGHEWFVWIPALQLTENSTNGLESASKDEPIAMGVLTTTVALSQPALEPGTYVVAWRTDGKPKKKKKSDDEEKEKKKDDDVPPIGGVLAPGSNSIARAAAEDDEDPFGGVVDYDHPAWIFYDAEMKPVASIRAGVPEAESVPKDDPFGTIAVLAMAEMTGEKDDPRNDSSIDASLDAVRLDGFVLGSRAKKGFAFRLELGVKPNAIPRTWRR
ncbi:formylglycine-generating enzyme family protein [Rohdeia mirabilis]